MRISEEGDEWFEMPADVWEYSKRPRKKLKLLADAQVPEPVVREIDRVGIRIERLPDSFRHRSDEAVLKRAQARGRVLLTLDRDFWDDHKHPFSHVYTGLIYVVEPPNRPAEILRSFGLVYGCFARTFPLDWWHQMKIRATVNEFQIKMPSYRSGLARYRVKLRRGRVLALEC